jgi:poly(3-hydroxybutyrate) depolymerase
MKFSLLVSALCAGLCKSANIKGLRRTDSDQLSDLVEFSPKSCEADRPICEVRLNDPKQCEGCPLVIFLQGLGGKAYPFALENNAFDGGIIGVYIENNNGWNTGMTDNEEVLQLDDVQFIANVIKEARDRFGLQDNKLFAIGSGTGAQMAYMLAANAGLDLPITGIIVKAMSLLSHPTQHGYGSMPNTQPTENSSHVSVLQIMGNTDHLVPLEGGETGAYQMNNYTLMSATDSIDTWAQHNVCDLNATHAEDIEEDGTVKANIISYDCPTDFVTLVKIISGHHNIGHQEIMDIKIDYDFIYRFIHDVDDLHFTEEE